MAKETTPISETSPLKYLKTQLERTIKNKNHYQLPDEYVERFRSENRIEYHGKKVFLRLREQVEISSFFFLSISPKGPHYR